MTPFDAAAWMLKQFKRNGFIYHEEAASHLLFMRDSALARFDNLGNLRLGKEVLREFEKMTPSAVYESADKFWRRRLPSDQKGRRQ